MVGEWEVGIKIARLFSLKSQGLSFQIMLPLCACLVISIALHAWLFFSQTWHFLERQQQDHLAQLIQIVAERAEVSLSSGDDAALLPTLYEVMRNGCLTGVALYDREGRPLFAYAAADRKLPVPPAVRREFQETRDQSVVVEDAPDSGSPTRGPVLFAAVYSGDESKRNSDRATSSGSGHKSQSPSGRIVGYVGGYFDLGYIDKVARHGTLRGTSILVFPTLLIAGIMYLIVRRIGKALDSIRDRFERPQEDKAGDSKELTEKELSGSSEIAALVRHFHRIKQEHALHVEQLKVASSYAEQANKAKNGFLACVSHELRTPMNGVIGMMELLLETNLDPEQQEYAQTVRSSAMSLHQILNDILDPSKVETGHLELETIDFDLHATLENVVDFLAPTAHEKGLEFVYRVDSDLPANLRGDQGRLRQVLMNLIGNAIKFTGTGEIVIDVAQDAESDTHSTIRYEILDTGVGISRDHQEKIFKSFAQFEISTSNESNGIGLGLIISRNLVELMGGSIGVESELGRGSRFWFTTVFEKQTECRPCTPQIPSTLLRKKILAVDDNETNRILICQYLASFGFEVATASTAQEGISKVMQAVQAEASYDLVLIDQNMPGMDGATLGRVIKADPRSRSAALVMLNPLGLRQELAALKEIGFTTIITKPIKRSQLFRILTKTLDLPETSHTAKRAEQDAESGTTLLKTNRERKFRVLLAEDNIVNQKLALILLEKQGYEAEVVPDGKQAVDALEKNDYDLVLMDIQMPEMDGLEATRVIRDPHSKVRNHQIPIIAITAHAMKGDRERCLAAGMDDYATKPIHVIKLFAIMERQLATQAGPKAMAT